MASRGLHARALVSTEPERASTIRGTNDRMLTFAADSLSHKPRRGVFLPTRDTTCRFVLTPPSSFAVF
jgi:hypothetical protein